MYEIDLLMVILGLVCGSFLNVCIYRLPRGESLSYPGSHCPGCQHPIAWRDNIPVISWLLLRGHCRRCRAAITLRDPLVELPAAVMAWTAATTRGTTVEIVLLFVLGCALIVLSVIDLDHYILPDIITKPGIVIGLAIAAIPNLGFPGWSPPLPTLMDALIGAGAGYFGLRGFAWLFARMAGKEGMGLGDVKLFAMIGAWLGWQALPFTIFCAAVLGSIAGITWMVVSGRNRRLPIPFGPYLALSAWIYIFYGKAFYAWYWRGIY
ncbi:MAG: prepilin peptidase [Magnetococcales bacterium]|nr:prepilin peptidase [Magnetococcales bacterium]